MDVDVTNNSLFVDNKNRPLRESFSPFYSVFSGNLAKGAEITQKRKRNTAEAFCPSLQAGNMVNTDTQNLGI